MLNTFSHREIYLYLNKIGMYLRKRRVYIFPNLVGVVLRLYYVTLSLGRVSLLTLVLEWAE